MRNEDLIPAVVRAVRTLQIFSAERPSVTPSVLAEELDVDSATARRLLQTLASVGVLRETVLGPHARFFAPTPRVLTLGSGYLSVHAWEIAQGYLREVARATGECACLAVLDGDEVVCVGAAAPPTGGLVRVHLRPGSHLGATTTAPGLVLLAGLPAGALDTRLDGRAAELDAAACRVVSEVRGRGHAYVEGEEAWSLAVPVNGDGQVVAALGLVGHQHALDPQARPHTQATLAEVADELGGLLPPAPRDPPVGVASPASQR